MSTSPENAGPQRKIVCHAEGDRCLGCSHYQGKSAECEFAPSIRAQSTGTIEALVAAHSAELDRLRKMQKEIGHCDRDKGWQGGRISGLALAIEIAKSGSVITVMPDSGGAGTLPQRMSETTDNAIKALTGLFSILRGKSFAKDHYQLEISHGLYNELRDVRDRLVAERTAALTRPEGKCPRCKGNPADPVLLGSDEEGHICGACWTQDRHEASAVASHESKTP